MADDCTAKFKVDISDLKKNITEANRQIKLANATFKAETAGMDAWSKSVDGISAKLKQLKSNLNTQKSVLTSYETQLERQNQAYSENVKKADELKSKLQELSNNGVKKSDEEYRKYQKALTDVTREQANNAKAADDLKIKILNQKAAIGQTEASIRKFTAEQDQLEKDTKILNGEFGTQEERLEALKRQYDRVATAQGKDSDEAKSLSKQIEALSRDMNSNQNEMQQSEKKSSSLNQNFGKLTATVKSLGSKLSGALKTGLKTAATGMATIAGSAVIAGKKIYDSAQATADYGDEVDKMSQKLGLSSKAYQEWDYVLSQSGVEITNLSTGMKTMTNQIDAAKKGNEDAIDRFKQLGISISDLNNLSREDIFSKIITGFQNMEDSISRAALANKIFGRSGQELTPLFNSTVEGTEALKNKANELGFVMSDSGVKSSAAFKDSLDTLKRSFTGAKNNILGELLPSITLVMDGMSKLAAGTDGASESIKKGASGIVKSLANALPGLTEIGTSLIEAIAESAPDIVQALADGIAENASKLVTSFTKVITSLITDVDYSKISKSLADGVKKIDWKQVFNSIVDAFGGLTEAFASLFGIDVDSTNLKDSFKEITEPVGKLLDSFKEMADRILPLIVENFLPTLGTLISSIAAGITPIVTAVTPLFEKIIPIVSNIIEKFSPVLEKIGEFISKIITELSPILDPIFDLISEVTDILAPTKSTVMDLLSGLFDFIKPAIMELKPLIESVSNAIKGIITAFSGVVEFLSGVFSGDWDKALGGLKKAVSGAFDFIKNIGISVWNIITAPFRAIGKFISTVWEKVTKWFEDNNIGKFFEEVWKNITSVFSGVGTFFSDIFKNAVKGIKDAWNGIKTWFSNLWKGIWNVIKQPINWIIGGVNAIIDGLNSLSFDIPDWVPFVGGQKWGFNIPKIPELARGGIVDKPTRALIGEAGREAVVPLERNTQWIRQLANDLLNSMLSLSGGSVTNNNSGGNNSLTKNSEYNFTQIINAPKAPTRLELYRQTQNILSLAKATGGKA